MILSPKLRAHKIYEQLRVVDDMNDLGSRELNPIDSINLLRLWMI